MRVRGVLGFAFGLAATATLASCNGPAHPAVGHGRPYQQGNGKPHDTDVVIYLEATDNGNSCRVLKSDATAGFHGQKVTWHIRGNCQRLNNQPVNGQTLSLTFDDDASPVTSCPVHTVCTSQPITLSNNMLAADLQITIDPSNVGQSPPAPGWYHIKLTIGSTSLDPDLEIDP